MSGSSNSIVTKLTSRIFPPMPDFYGLIVSHCDLVCRSMASFVEFMESGANMEKGNLVVRAYEMEGQDLKAHQMEILNSAFATPMDREDIYRAITTIDSILYLAKTAVRQVEALSIKPDAHMIEMSRLLKSGADALRNGYGKLATHPAQAEADANAAHNAHRMLNRSYRAALAELFNVDSEIAGLKQNVEGIEIKAFQHIVEMFKRREIYRHLSDAAVRMDRGADILHDIVVQIA